MQNTVRGGADEPLETAKKGFKQRGVVFPVTLNHDEIQEGT
jgi:hypothetical protein